MPDPVTAHTAENAVCQPVPQGPKPRPLPPPWVLWLALPCSKYGRFTTADELAQKGGLTLPPDGCRRRDRGGCRRGLRAAGGRADLGQTWALHWLADPVSFVTQQAATREILQRADYGKLADQYDPFDPWA